VHEAAIVNILGGERLLGKNATTFDGFIAALKKGLPIKTLDALAGTLLLKRSEAVALLDIPPRTLARRKKEKKFTEGESNRLARIARITARATEAIGDSAKAARWLRAPNRALGGKIPLSVIMAENGLPEVEAVLGRIEHGIHS
jgi:putative toxin-antitoxin system antitoxin component (TIGR02293 family)